MKRNHWVTAAVSAALAFCIALGTAGCMVSGFHLTLEHAPALVLICAAAALFCSAAFSLKRGGILVALVTTLLAGYLWRKGTAGEQYLQLIYRVSYTYDLAYRWGYLPLTDNAWNAGFADLPMGILAAVIAMTVSWTVCRRKRSFYAVSISLLPLFSCLVVTDTVPSEGYLFALLAGLILLLLTSHVRRSNPVQGNRLFFLSLLPTLLALTVLFQAVPQNSYVNQSAEIRDNILTWLAELPEKFEKSVEESPIQIQTSEPESVNLAALGRRIASTATVMEVTADVGGTLYLRGQDYDVYDGKGWTASPHRVEDFSYPGVSFGYVTIETRSKLEQLYLPYYPRDAASLIGGKVDNSRLAVQYTYARTGFGEDLGALLAREASPASVSGSNHQPQEAYLALPDSTRSEGEALLSGILSDEDTATEKAERIAEFVRSSASYDLNPGRMPGEEEDFALWFLKDSDKGYCVHFATATTVLLRAAGIEARYVSGYMARVRSGETAAVTGENAHAWAEYYEPLLGVWLVLESTPADLEDYTPISSGELPTAPEFTEPPATEPPESVTDPAAQPTAAPTVPVETSPTSGQTRDLRRLKTLLLAILLSVILAALLEGQRRLRIRLRRAHQRKGTTNAQALARWQEAELIAKLLKEPTPEDLESLAQKAKFSQHTLTSEELLAFEAYLRPARNRLRQKPWYRRLVHRYVFAIY